MNNKPTTHTQINSYPILVPSLFSQPQATNNEQPNPLLNSEIWTISVKVATLQGDMQKRDAQILSALKKNVEAREKLDQCNTDMMNLRETSWRSKAETSSAVAAVAAVASGISTMSVSRNTSQASLPVVILVDSYSLHDVFKQMRRNSIPAIYDFQGRDMKFARGGEIGSSEMFWGVTWRNGKIKLEGDISLEIYALGSGMVMESISIFSEVGETNYPMQVFGNLTLKDCEICNATIGLHVHSSGVLIANNLKIEKCSAGSLQLVGNAVAIVTDCQLTGAGRAGIIMTDHSRMVGTRVRITGTRGGVLCLDKCSRLSLTDCTMKNNQPGYVRDAAGLVLTSCALDEHGKFEQGSGATVEVF